MTTRPHTKGALMAQNWNETPCKACKKPIPVDALICPYCRTEYTGAEADVRKRHNADQNKSALQGCLILLAMVVAALLLVRSCSGDDKDDAEPHAKVEAAQTEPPKPSDTEIVTQTFRVIENYGAVCESAYNTMKGSRSATDRYENAAAAIVQCDLAGDEIRKIPVASDVPTQNLLGQCRAIYYNARDAAKLFQRKADIGALRSSEEVELRDDIENTDAFIENCNHSKNELRQ